MAPTKGNGFQGTVLTHLKYIREEQTDQKKNIGKLFDKIDEVKKDFSGNLTDQKVVCQKRFKGIEKDVDTTKGFAKGAMAVGAIGGGTGLIAGILRFIGMK